MNKMNKIMAILFIALFTISSSIAIASPPVNPGPGYYEKQNGETAGTIKYFPNGQPENNSEWKFLGATPPGSCTGKNCYNTAVATAIANPYFGKGSTNPLGNASGGYIVEAEGNIQVDSFAKGSKSADAFAIASGQAFGIGGAAGFETICFGIGASGAFSGVMLEGAGYGLGVDKFGKTGDLASVEITYGGYASQSNGIEVNNDQGTFAGGWNETTAAFSRGSLSTDPKFSGIGGTFFDLLTPAFAINADCAGAYASGFSFGTYVNGPNFVAAKSLTYGFSGYLADSGYVTGQGAAYHQAVAVGSQGGYGISAGTAEFCYSGSGNFGSGYATTGGYSTVTNSVNSSSVISVSSAHAGSSVGGGGSHQLQK